MPEKKRSERNRTITLDVEEKEKFLNKVIKPVSKLSLEQIINKTLLGDITEIAGYLPENSVDLLIIDPPYNLDRKFNEVKFKKRSIDDYTIWLENIIKLTKPMLKKNASVYVCGEWKSSTSIHIILEKYFFVKNRITWERVKGRGSLRNWKNNSEDIWFAVNSKDDFVFNVDSVKMKRTVIAPYRNSDGTPKDWEESEGGNFRATFPSNLWNDLTVPFWSMPENTDHPTQKPEKLIAKLILASSNEGDLVFDPFLGSGTTSVTAKKLGRYYCGVEIDPEYCAITEKRLEIADRVPEIQGFDGHYFWERNSWPKNKNNK